ncbi:DUF4194 domain-containing protein [Lampropedia aestuarii]|uniref:DUF4194 domain-containing protein n=1 Tax=Lampropedia aestuarii TaxID=2562762 RepID=UPI0024684BAA|nr:DUF4194 domain-containing protein [Lampropedia aestuarii]MDH5856617.1 DUF4194 domain-containing protein [Lampropedia aestuarii]
MPSDSETGLDFFDQLATQAADKVQPRGASVQFDEMPGALAQDSLEKPLLRTPLTLRRAVQELLKHGWLEHGTKPRLFKIIATETVRINQLLEPLDLEAKVDELRGLAFASVLPDFLNDDAEQDEWAHPLMFRQRLTLEHSLVLAILRREFIQQEQQGGVGVAVRMAVDDLLLQLDTFIDRSGSDMQDRKRVLTALEALRKHGVVSELDAQDYIGIRPMIVHLANPENLQALLQHLKNLSAQASSAVQSTDDGDDTAQEA